MKNQMNLQNYAVISLFLCYSSTMWTDIRTHGRAHDDVAPLGDDVENLGSITSADETPAVTPHRGSLKLCGLVRINAVNKITFFYSSCHNIVYLKSKFWGHFCLSDSFKSGVGLALCEGYTSSCLSERIILNGRWEFFYFLELEECSFLRFV